MEREGEGEQLGRDEEMSAWRVRGFIGEGGGVGKNRDWNPPGMHKERKHLGWLNSSQSLQQKSGRGEMEGRDESVQCYVLQYISNSPVSVLKVLTKNWGLWGRGWELIFFFFKKGPLHVAKFANIYPYLQHKQVPGSSVKVINVSGNPFRTILRVDKYQCFYFLFGSSQRQQSPGTVSSIGVCMHAHVGVGVFQKSNEEMNKRAHCKDTAA